MSRKRAAAVFLAGLLVLLSAEAAEARVEPAVRAPEAVQLLSYAKARAILLNKVVKPKSLAADDAVIAFRLRKPLRAGQLLTPFFGPGLPFRVTGPAWFFWVDDEPYARFEHQTRYVLVDARTGKVKVAVRSWWPLLDGVAPWFDASNYWNRGNWAYSNVQPPAPSPQRLVAHASAAAGTAECAVIVDGGDPRVGTTDDANGMGDVLRVVFGLDTRKLGPPGNQKADIEQAVDELAEDGCTNMLLYVSSHGGDGFVLLGREKATVNDLKALIQRYPDVGFKVVVDACFSGSFVEPLRGLVEIVITATDSKSYAWGDEDPPEDPNPTDKGGEFSSGLIEDLRAIPNDQKLLQDIQICLGQGKPLLVCKLRIAYRSAVAKDAGVKKGKTKPQIWEE